jgi:hypothetical protein
MAWIYPLVMVAVSLVRKSYLSGHMSSGLFAALDPIGYYLMDIRRDKSPTYDTDSGTPQLTTSRGTPRPLARGICKLSGNKVRQNNYGMSAETHIKVIVDFGEGPWEEILTHYINDMEWSELTGDNQFWVHLGTADQGAINNLFSDHAHGYRNRVVVEYKIEKNAKISSLDNINVIARTGYCLQIGQGMGGTATFTRNPAQIAWDHYIRKEKRVVSELNVNAFQSLYAYCGEPLATVDTGSGTSTTTSVSAINATATTWANGGETSMRPHNPILLLDPSLSVTGQSGWYAGWLSDGMENITDQRLNFDFGKAIILTEIDFVNWHKAGIDTEIGIKNFIIQGSNDPADFSYTTYADGASGWITIQTNLHVPQHVSSDIADWQEVIFNNHTAYRYYSLKIADNWGSIYYMGIRGIRFYMGNADDEVSGTDESNVRYTFDYNCDTNMSRHDYKKLLEKAFNGSFMQSQGQIKPVWEGAQEADGSGGLQTKAVKLTFGIDTNIEASGVTRYRLKRYNVFRVNFIDSSRDYKKDVAEFRDGPDIAANGEIVQEDTCWWLTEWALAKRRVKLMANKAMYRNWGCRLPGLPSTQLLERLDRVAVTVSRYDWTARDFTVIEKSEDLYGNPVYTLEEYLSGVYNDQGYQQQSSYSTRSPVTTIPEETQASLAAIYAKTYPYIINWQDAPVTSTLTVSFYAMDVVFQGMIVQIPAWTHTFTASMITNIWIDSQGYTTYEEVDPANYTEATRYTDKIMIAEVTTGPTKVVSVYFRGDVRALVESVERRPINYDEIISLYYIKPHNKDWGAIAVVGGDVVKTSSGNLYLVVNSGMLSATEPTLPSYSYELHNGFHEQESGTAVVAYIGKDTYEGAWREAYMSGVNWYFANLGIGWLAKSNSALAQSLAAEMLNHIRAEIDRACRPWQAAFLYYYGMLCTDPAGYVWQFRETSGTSDSSASFPASPTPGTTTYEDNGNTWRCFGRTSVHSPAIDWQLVDTNVTMDQFKYPDSHDAYAGSMMWALEQLRASGMVPDAFFTETSKHGISYVDAVQEILYYNILNQETNNLTRTFQYDLFPDGVSDPWGLQYLMDNCEVWAGLQAAYDFYSDARYTTDPTYPAYVAGHRDTILVGINSLWDSTYKIFKYYLGYDISTTPINPIFYPWIMSQAWPRLWDVPVDYYKIRSCMSYMQAQYPDWWKINNIDDLAALGSHVAFYKHTMNSDILREILDRVEVDKLILSGSELWLMDMGYYQWLKSGTFK